MLTPDPIDREVNAMLRVIGASEPSDVAQLGGAYMYTLERLYRERIAILESALAESRKALGVSQRMERVYARQVEIAELAITRMQGNLAAAVPVVVQQRAEWVVVLGAFLAGLIALPLVMWLVVASGWGR